MTTSPKISAVSDNALFFDQSRVGQQVFCLVEPSLSVLFTFPRRFLLNIDFQAEGCWQWKGPRAVNPRYRHQQYGVYDWTENGNRKCTTAHRFAYQSAFGPVPSGLELDHLCENKLCVNPDHLESVTRSENMLRVFARRKESEASL